MKTCYLMGTNQLPQAAQMLLQTTTRAATTTTSASTEATSQPVEVPLAPVLQGVIAVGCCVLVVLVARRLIRPRKLTLANSPGRPNKLRFEQLFGLFVLWLGRLVGVSYLPPGKWKILGVAGVQIVWLAASLLIASKTFSNGLVRGLGLSFRHRLYDTGRGVVAFFAVMPMCIGTFLLTMMLMGLFIPAEELQRWLYENRHELFQVMEDRKSVV